MKYEIIIWGDDGTPLDILCVGTPKGNIPEWAIVNIQRHVREGRKVEITMDPAVRAVLP